VDEPRVSGEKVRGVGAVGVEGQQSGD
jgi:hypothetical protein